MKAPRRWSLAAQIFVLQALVAGVVVVAGAAAAYLQVRGAGEDQATQRVLAVAHTVAATPEVVDAVQSAAPTAVLQPLAEQVRRDTATDFVVVMSPAGVRYSHPDAGQIGRRFIGTIAPAQNGKDVTETYAGTLGPSIRAVVPVRSGQVVVGLVSVGIRQITVAHALSERLPALLLAAALATVLSGAGTLLVARRVRRQTHGLGAEELRRMYEYYDAVLHAVREGLLLVDVQGRLRLVNDEARRLLDLPRDVTGVQVSRLRLPPSLLATLASGEVRRDELHVTAARVVVLNQARATWQGRDVGTVVTLRDRTDLEALTGELDTARGMTEALRSQQHESANRLHTVVSLIEMGRAQEALEFATDELSQAQRLTDEVVAAVAEPALAALLLGKSAQGTERGIELVIEPGSQVPDGVVPARELVTIVGNLIDNALDALSDAEAGSAVGGVGGVGGGGVFGGFGGGGGVRQVRFAAGLEDGEVVLEVSDTGPGLPGEDPMQAFARGFSTKEPGGAGGRGLGLALVAQSVRRLGGTITVSGPPGAHFEVRLPAHPRPYPVEPPLEASV